MNVPIILAGGVGSRVGADRPKQFIEILGKPILVYTIEAFQNHPEIDAIEVVCIESHIDYLKELVEKFNLDKVKWITPGGKDFQHSVINGFNNLKGKLDDKDIVLVHYGASPFISEDIISDAIPLGAVQITSAGLPVVMAADRQTTGGYAKIACVKKESMCMKLT